MRVVVDYELCESHGVCLTVAPEIFDIDDDDNLMVRQEVVEGGTVDIVSQAVAGCPRAAISMVSEEDAADGN